MSSTSMTGRKLCPIRCLIAQPNAFGAQIGFPWFGAAPLVWCSGGIQKLLRSVPPGADFGRQLIPDSGSIEQAPVHELPTEHPASFMKMYHVQEAPKLK